ncbi:glycosyltransferase family 2 protein [Acinetobacter sp. NCu2D-2]|uniref:glycosyltransferase family 2 protein n=1 Tax=Acinetobacter sp. NCu2D-2 TaxID=1608473 RepID=UPI0012FEBCC8|nr:glycosyltransferase family 2 protein [Acinetobacter sp. NCu2D-2]
MTYNPDIENLINLVSSLHQSQLKVIVVDNASSQKISFEKMNDVIVIALKDNLGIAKAQNIGIRKAIEVGCKKIIFFDQDSQIDHDFIKNLISDYEKLKDKGNKVAAIGPQFIDKKLGFYAPGLILRKNGLVKKIDISKIKEPKKVDLIISSGSLIPIEVLQDVGLMNEDFFIDYVDTEWCFRALSKGYKIYVSPRAIMHHSVGDSTIRFMGLTCPVHSAFRRYYRVRNLFLMWNMRHIKKKWIIKMFVHNLIAQILLILTQKNRMAYIKYFIKSIRDGIKEIKRG